MRVWVITVDIVNGDESYCEVKGVYQNRSKADEVFSNLIDEMDDYDFDTKHIEPDFCETYNMGWYNDGHFVARIERVELE